MRNSAIPRNDRNDVYGYKETGAGFKSMKDMYDSIYDVEL